MDKTIKQTFDEIVAFQNENPEQNRSGCLYNQNAQGEILRNYTIQDEVFKNCNFYTAKLISCKFINCTFLQCDFSSVEFINCKFITCRIDNSIFTNAILTDTSFIDCIKSNNILNHLHCTGRSKGLTPKDENIMQDEIVNENTDETAAQQDFKHVFKEKILKIMQENFPNWDILENDDQHDYPSFAYEDADATIGIALYSDQQKNSTDSDNFWCLSIFFKDDSLLTNDFNFFGLEAKDIVSIINDWKENVLKNNAALVLERIFENLK